MKRWLALLPLLSVLAACHSRKASPTAPDYAGVKARSENSFSELGAGGKKAAPPAPVPETPAPSAKVLEKDAVLGCTWVASSATVLAPHEQSRDQIRARAVEEALTAAMRGLLGVDINQRSLNFQQESLRGQTAVIESVLRTTQRGCILDQKVLVDEYRSLGTCKDCGFFVDLKVCVKERPSDWDKDFQVELFIDRDHFVEGDEAKVMVTSRRDAYLYLYDVGMNSETSLIVPNSYVPEVKVPAGRTWGYPDEAAAKRGVHLVAQMPEGNPPISAETIRVVATKIPLPASIMDPGRGGYLGVLRRLNKSGMEWAEDAAAFTISPAKEK